MASKSNKAMFVCDSCTDKCAYCGKITKDLHCTCNYPSKCKSCGDAYKDSNCAICGARLPKREHTVRRCPGCLRECKKCFKCHCDVK